MLRGFDRKASFDLSEDQVDLIVPRGASGRYVLGYRDSRGSFRNQFAGRAGLDLNTVLKESIGIYRQFKFITDETDRQRDRNRGSKNVIGETGS